MDIKFAHISPVSYLPFIKSYSTHLLLAHLVEENEVYRNFYVNLKRKNPNVFYHLDNSAFEMFKRGEPMYPAEKLLKMADLVGANSIVMSDYPKEDWQKTVESAQRLIPRFKKRGYQTFFCPQSELGDLEGLMRGYEWGLKNDHIDYLGISILNCPIALGINETKHGNGAREESFRMQRYLSRLAIFQELEKRGMLNYGQKRFHCLGMTEGPKEISLLKQYFPYIFSWDSSSAIWHAINGIEFDNSPTGLSKGKLDLEVDFNIEPVTFFDTLSSVVYNLSYIDDMCIVRGSDSEWRW
jgi:hypothetical protein